MENEARGKIKFSQAFPEKADWQAAEHFVREFALFRSSFTDYS